MRFSVILSRRSHTIRTSLGRHTYTPIVWMPWVTLPSPIAGFSKVLTFTTSCVLNIFAPLGLLLRMTLLDSFLMTTYDWRTDGLDIAGHQRPDHLYLSSLCLWCNSAILEISVWFIMMLLCQDLPSFLQV